MKSRPGITFLKELTPPSPSALLLRGEGAQHDVLYLWWIGQAGFLMRYNGTVICIDPYLSDSLAVKYEGKIFQHQRMMPPPLSPQEVNPCDYLFVTHGHSDHLDPLTAGAVAGNTGCTCIIPEVCRELARQRGVPLDKMRGVTSGDRFEIGPDISVQVLPAAHEDVAVDDKGHNLYVGYSFRFKDLVVYHSGDCVPFGGQVQALINAGVQVALLPINGRDEVRTRNGVIGNFTATEALALCEDAGTANLVMHHFGMFSFNDADLAETQSIIQQRQSAVHCVIPAVTHVYGCSCLT